jgi:predicted alpha/beta-fold hydrolase
VQNAQGADTPIEAAVSMCNPFDLTISNKQINEVRSHINSL